MPSVGGAIAGVGALLGGGISALGANRAAGTQAAATQQGQYIQLEEFQNIANLMGPYIGQGQAGLNMLQKNLGNWTTPFQPTMAQLEQTPGYQFTLNQGQQAVANAYSGQGLGAGVTQTPSTTPGQPGGGTAMTPSGPGVKGAINYAEGLAGTTYQQQFNNYLAQNQQAFNMSMGVGQLGEQATAALAGVGQNMSNQVSNLIGAGGAATASGQQGVANALGQGISGATGNFALYNALGGGNFFGNQGSLVPTDAEITAGLGNA